MYRNIIDVISNPVELVSFYQWAGYEEHQKETDGSDEVLFVSLSARNKYLTEQERRATGLGRTEMFERKIIHDMSVHSFLDVIKRYEIERSVYKSRAGQVIPYHALRVYMNINPSSMMKATSAFIQNVLLMQNEALLSDGKHLQYVKTMQKADSYFKKFIQKSRGTKLFVDFDFDWIPEYAQQAYDWIQEQFVAPLLNIGADVAKIKSGGGVHVVIRVNSLSGCGKDINPYTLIKTAPQELFSEATLNSNEMIPLPGIFGITWEYV